MFMPTFLNGYNSFKYSVIYFRQLEFCPAFRVIGKRSRVNKANFQGRGSTDSFSDSRRTDDNDITAQQVVDKWFIPIE